MFNEPPAADAVLLIRPACFGFHAEAAQSNVFAAASSSSGDVQAMALAEFEALGQRLSDAGVEVLVLDDAPEPAKPDAVFPNNWISFHADGTMVLYPMATAARRLERDADRVRQFLETKGFEVRRIIDLTFHDRHGRFLEGTGSLLLDRPNRRAFASLGPRTDAAAIADFDDRLDYSTFIFDARDRTGRPIYHTNVLMSLGSHFAILCTETVDEAHRDVLIGEIAASGRALIEVDHDQMCRFACNLIELRSSRGGPLIAMSAAALASLRPNQKKQLESFGQILDVAVPTIEAVGGGSVRCMIADVHLPRRASPAL